jgi:thymidylate kinase
MFAADRESVAYEIKKNVIDGKIVICDRYTYSAIAYHIPLTVTNSQIINNYSKIIGHFDSKMPKPDVVYLIDGDHLLKRGIVYHEKFHYSGSNSRLMHNMLYKVISLNTHQFVVLKNKENHLDDLVKYISNDIFLRR